MKVIVAANVEQRKEILMKNTNKIVEMIFATSYSEVKNDSYDAVFLLNGNENLDFTTLSDKPFFINSVTETLQQNNLPGNFNRVNGWPGFLKRSIWEIAAGDRNVAGKIFEQLGWNIVFVKDEPGLIAARVISMIINEAFFALEEGISTKNEIDLAMKLGTNYPFGPFEWQEKIGVQNIYRLLYKLSATDKRYRVAPLLEQKYLELSSSL